MKRVIDFEPVPLPWQKKGNNAKMNAELTIKKLKELATTTPLTIEGVKKLTDGIRNKHIS